MLYIPVKKILKVVSTKRPSKKRERFPKSLSDCLDENVDDKKNNIIIIWTIVILLITYSCRSIYLTYLGYMNSNYLQFKTSEQAFAFSDYRNDSQYKDLPLCSVNITSLGNVSINKTITKYLPELIYPMVKTGGYYHPNDCRPSHKVAILVPYRDRENHLAIFLYNIHNFLIRQKIEYRIFVVKQTGTDSFNRGKLFNAGFLEVKKFGEWMCIVFHDVDLLPLDDRIRYSCPIWPRHMCAKVVEVTNKKFRTLFGGVSSMKVKQFEKVNGYSNVYWGWGGEDNDLFNRIQALGYPLLKNSKRIGRYTSLKHPVQAPNFLRYSLLRTSTKRYKKEGLSTLKYNVKTVMLHPLYTHIVVDINPNQENVLELLLKWTL